MLKILKTYLQREPYSYYLKIFLSNAWDIWNDLLKSQVCVCLEFCSFIKILLIPLPPSFPGLHCSQAILPHSLPSYWLAHICESAPPSAFCTHVPRPVSIATKLATNLFNLNSEKTSAVTFIFLEFSWYLGIHHPI